MNKQNFDINSTTNYPLTIDRMAEFQTDTQVALNVLANMEPLGNCILAGCQSTGAAGYVLAKIDDLYEVFEVKKGSTSATYLKLNTKETKADNSDGESPVVRIERWLEWAASGDIAYETLPRLWLKKTPQDDEAWTACANGTNWNAGTSGTSLRVQRVGGRVHLWGEMTYQPYVIASSELIQTGYFTQFMNRQVSEGEMIKVTNVPSLISEPTIRSLLDRDTVVKRISLLLTLPGGYYKSGSMILVPILYNGVASSAVIDGEGNLQLSQTIEAGDVLKIDCWFDI